MNYCSYFIQNKALFGSYPTNISELENAGVRYFIDLTSPGERKISPYKTQYFYLNYPIRDHKVPTNWKTFAHLILYICSLIRKLKTNELIYTHCRGGHGRSGIVVACVLSHLYKILPFEALKLTNEYHANRVEMKETRRKLGSPSSLFQRTFVYKFCMPLYFQQTHTNYLSTYSIHSVHVLGVGTFPTAESAFQAHKDLNNAEYVKKQENAFLPYVSKKIGYECKPGRDWHEKKEGVMAKVLQLKFSQNNFIREALLKTGLKPIVFHNNNSFWGDGGDGGKGKNVLGRLLTKLRNKLYLN